MCNISDYKWHSIVKMFYEDFDYNGDSVSIIVRHCFQDTNSLEDFRCSDIPSVAKVLEPLRKQIYGILLFEKPGSPKVVEWLVDGYESLARPVDVYPQFPRVHHPGLLTLMRGCDKDASWTLLGDIFNLNPSDMKNLQEHLLVPALCFRYLKDKFIIHKWESNALILSAVLVKYFSIKQLKLIRLDKIKSRPIRLYNLVTCTFEAVLQIFQILGNLINVELTLPSNYQDGKLFQLIYKLSFDEQMSVKDVLRNLFNSYFENNYNDETSLEQFEMMSSIIEN